MVPFSEKEEKINQNKNGEINENIHGINNYIFIIHVGGGNCAEYISFC